MSISSFKVDAYFRSVRDEYFFPLKWLYTYVSKKPDEDRSFQNRLHIEALTIAAGITAKAVCLNQGTYLQYAQLAAERHRRLKECLTLRSRRTQEIADSVKDLVDFMNQECFEAAHKNFELIHEYFASRSRTKPRICIKGNFRIGDSNKVVTIFRDKPVKYEIATELSLNTGFSYIEKTGTYFLNNDIVASVKNNKYVNPRLNVSRVLSKNSQDGVDRTDWLASWTGATDQSDAYQSTLIIPMTLWNNQLNKEFRDFLKINDIGRTIFGYLCIDHAEPNYFDKKLDVQVGYVFADLISMYFFSRKIYIDISKTLAAAKSVLKDKEIESTLATIVSSAAHLDEALHRNKELRELDGRVSLSNTLVSIDRNLIKFIGADVILGEEDFPSSSVGPRNH
jgi:hypothetical protein